MIQIAGKSEAIEVIRLIASGVEICQIQYQCELNMLQDAAPVIASFVFWSYPLARQSQQMCPVFLITFANSCWLCFKTQHSKPFQTHQQTKKLIRSFLAEHQTALIPAHMLWVWNHEIPWVPASSISMASAANRPIFRTPTFFVDRFHWRGHVVDKYTTSDISSKLPGQWTSKRRSAADQGENKHMKPENFMFHVKLFLSIMNMDK